MIPLPFNENRFSFFLLQTIYELASCVQIPRAIGAFYHVWKWHNIQRARSEMRRCKTHALYQSKLWQQDSLPAPSKCKFGQFNAGGHFSTHRTTFLEVVEWKPKAEDTARKIWTKEFIEKVQAIIDETPQRVVIPWCNQVAGGRPWVWQQDSVPAHKSKETQAWLQVCYDFVPFSHCPHLLPRPEPAGLHRLVIRREYHQHDLPQHQSQPDRFHPPSFHRAHAGTCEKDMLLVPDPYRGGDWGWRWLHWIDVSSTT